MMLKLKFITSQLVVCLHFVILAAALAGCAGNADNLTVDQQNIIVVRAYFTALDNNDSAAIQKLFDANATQEFVGSDPLVGVDAILHLFQLQGAQLKSMKTTFLTSVADGDTVAVQVRHDAVFKAGGAVKTRTGVTPPVVIFAADTPIT